MSAAPRIRWRGTVASRGEVGDIIPLTGDCVLVARGGHVRWLVFRCPSGCGTELPINLDERAGPAWRLYNPGPSASLYPSVWRDSGCGAHFILSHGNLWVASNDDRWWNDEEGLDDPLTTRVRSALSSTARHYWHVAEELGAEPWDILRACRRLVRAGDADEGSGESECHFRRR